MEYKEDIINSNINYQNEIKDNNSNLLKHNSISVNNIEIQSHINSFTLTPSTIEEVDEESTRQVSNNKLNKEIMKLNVENNTKNNNNIDISSNNNNNKIITNKTSSSNNKICRRSIK